MRGFKNNFAQVFFLLSPLAVKRDIAVTILLRCMCVRVCMHACLCMSIRICLGHTSYMYAWISKLFNTIVVLGEEKCHLKHCLGRLKVKVTLEGHINELFGAITPTYMHGFQNNFAQVFSLKSRIAI